MIRKILSYIRGSLLSLIKFDKINILSQIGRVYIIKKYGKIVIGKRTVLWPNVKLSVNGKKEKYAFISIGERCSIGDRTEIHCGNRIRIGNDVIISWDCNLLDRDYHDPDGLEETIGEIEIGDRVWIGCRSIILKNVKIGDNSVIGAGSIVTKDVPSNTLVAGAPARVIKRVKGWRGQK